MILNGYGIDSQNVMDKFLEKNRKVKDLLDKIGKGMCLAKWTQTTIHLGLGHTHSCHHPRTHKIPIEEIKKNPSALHNTEYKKNLRREMLSDIRPVECNYCWNVEDLNLQNEFSDRILKSSETWSLPYYDRIVQAPPNDDFNPTYVEISFSNVCNFKCSYCMPSVSSQWMEEIERHGGYPTSTLYNNLEWVKKQDKMPIPNREYNPYIEAFWKWWPDLYKEVEHFRITGGEPLLDKNTFRVLDYVIANPNPSLELSINTNLHIPEELYDRFIEKIKIIDAKGCVKKFTLYTSCEAHGDAAEYIRFGLSYEAWKTNFIRFINEIKNSSVIIMATYNAMSVTTFETFLSDVLIFKKHSAYLNCLDNGSRKVSIDIPYLNNPPHQNINILTDDFLLYFNKQLEFIQNNRVDYAKSLPGFDELEYHKMHRIKKLFAESLSTNLSSQMMINRKDFKIFVDEHDRRRGTNFLKSFPEMTEFYILCGSYR